MGWSIGFDGGNPGGVAYRVLYAVIALFLSASVLFRFLVLGKDLFVPFWANLIVLIFIFALGVYAVFVLLGVFM